MNVKAPYELSTATSCVVIDSKQLPRRQDRFVLSVEISTSEGVFQRHRLTVSDEYVLKAGLRPGVALEGRSLTDLLTAVASVRAHDLALDAVARKGRSSSELHQLLRRRGIAPALASAAVGRLTRLGILDDERFAREFVRARVSGRGASVWSLRRDLGRKGIAREVVDSAIAEVSSDVGLGDAELARRVAAKKWRSLARLERSLARRRLIAFLRRQGFSGDTVRPIVRELTAD